MYLNVVVLFCCLMRTSISTNGKTSQGQERGLHDLFDALEDLHKRVKNTLV